MRSDGRKDSAPRHSSCSLPVLFVLPRSSLLRRTPGDPDAVKGQLEFQSKCLACHANGGGKKLGPDLAGVTKRRTERWLTMWGLSYGRSR